MCGEGESPRTSGGGDSQLSLLFRSIGETNKKENVLKKPDSLVKSADAKSGGGLKVDIRRDGDDDRGKMATNEGK